MQEIRDRVTRRTPGLLLHIMRLLSFFWISDCYHIVVLKKQNIWNTYNGVYIDKSSQNVHFISIISSEDWCCKTIKYKCVICLGGVRSVRPDQLLRGQTLVSVSQCKNTEGHSMSQQLTTQPRHLISHWTPVLASDWVMITWDNQKTRDHSKFSGFDLFYWSTDPCSIPRI